jgi:NADH-quinone oxidoreductase subunit F
MLEILERIVAGEGRKDDIELLLELAETISATALCGLGNSAASPVVGTIERFRDEYEAHIFEKRCPAGTCKKLKNFKIESELCRGCSKCAKVCPVDAITGSFREPFFIDARKCIRCGACVDACPFNAVRGVN